MRHPAEYFIKYLLLRESLSPNGITDAQVVHSLDELGLLSPHPQYLPLLRQELQQNPPPQPFEPFNRFNRPSALYLRDQKVYDMFVRTPAVEEAWEILGNQRLRLMAEKMVMANVTNKVTINKVNKKHGTFFTEAGVKAFEHYFWNRNLLTFDQWGRYLYDRSSLYSDYMALLRAPTQLAFYHLKLDQSLESKAMIRRSQQIAYNALEQVELQPGTGADKVKAIGVLVKAICTCDMALSSSDVAITGALQQFERFRMEHPQDPAPDIKMLSPGGSFSGSGSKVIDIPVDKAKVH